MGWSEPKKLQKKAVCINLGTDKTIDVVSICEENGIDYTLLSEENFIVGVSGGSANTNTTFKAVNGYLNRASKFTIGCSYDNSTGKLTLSGYTQKIYATDSTTAVETARTQTFTTFAFLVYIEE